MSGFESPNYTQTPNDLFDTLLPEMGLAELKVVLCIVRHTFGYHKEDVKMSIRSIARFTGLTVNSVMDGATKAEAHGLIERSLDGNKTTVWKAIVSVVPTKTRRISNRDAGVSPTETLSGVKERNKELKKHDLIDSMLEMANFPGAKRQARVDSILSYLAERLHINTETKKWLVFAKFVDDRQQHSTEKVEVFLAWLLSQDGFQLQYWPPSKMQEFWPSAFVEVPHNVSRQPDNSSGHYA